MNICLEGIHGETNYGAQREREREREKVASTF